MIFNNTMQRDRTLLLKNECINQAAQYKTSWRNRGAV